MKYISPSWLSLWDAVSIDLCQSLVTESEYLLAVVRPKVETELSIQDRHPTRKFGACKYLPVY